jgi:hypothetical protein
MAYHGSQRCVGCSAEDCVCCEVFLEEQASVRYAEIYGPEEQDPWDDDDYSDDDEYVDGEPDESMDGDFDTGMASAGFGTDEDYGCYGDD